MGEQTTEQRWAPGWKRDPWARFAGRYWDGTRWTEHVVSHDQVRTVDAPPRKTPERQGPAPAERERSAPTQAAPATPGPRPKGGRGRPLWALVGVCVVAGLSIAGAAALGGDDDEPAGSVPAQCRSANAQALRILEGLKAGGAALRSANAVALDPPVGALRFVVAAEIDGPGALSVNSQIGAWAVASADGTGLLVALDENAQQYSTWGQDATDGSPAALLRDKAAARPEVGVAKACVGG
ncbi:MAG: DUF2510 domain-containing protein [Acidimicrobiales bacterium]